MDGVLDKLFALRLAVDFDLLLRGQHQPALLHAGGGVGVTSDTSNRRENLRDNCRHRASRFAVLGLKAHRQMAGKFLAFPGLGKETMYVVSTRGGQLVLGAPDLL